MPYSEPNLSKNIYIRQDQSQDFNRIFNKSCTFLYRLNAMKIGQDFLDIQTIDKFEKFYKILYFQPFICQSPE